MAGSSEVRTLLSRHKVSLLCELNTTDLLNVLVKRGVITEIDKDAVAGNVDRSTDSDVDLFIDIIGAKGFEAFREFCFALEAKCPHVLTNILVDQSITGESFYFLIFLFCTKKKKNIYFISSNGVNTEKGFFYFILFSAREGDGCLVD